MAFDVDGARKAGYSDAEIADHLAQQSKFDVDAARKAGYTDADVIAHLSAPPAKPAKPTVGDYVAEAVKAPLTWAQNYAADYGSRAKGAWNALTGDVMEPTKGANAIPGVRGAKIVMDAATAASVPFMAAVDQAVGRPVEIVSGGRIPHQTASDVASIVVPFAGEVNALRQGDKAAQAAGMTYQGLKNMQAATEATRNALAAKAVPKAVAKPNALSPFKAAVSDDAAQQQAGQVIADRASDVEAVKKALAKGPAPKVAGSTPTTGQQTGDMGVLSLEREQATKNPVPFRERAGEQNAARVQALSGVQSGGDPVALGKEFRAHLDDLDAQTQQAVDTAQAAGDAHVAATDAATQTAVASAAQTGREASDAIGGAGAPETYGERVRGALTAANSAAKAKVNTLFRAVDPNGDLTAHVGPTKNAAATIQAEVRPTTMPMSAAESHVFEAARGMPDVAPARDLMDLSQQVSAVKSAELRTAGETPTYRRLSMLHDAIKDNLANAVETRAATDDAAVKAGTIAPDAAMAAKFKAVVDGWKQERVAARTGAGGGDLGNTGTRAPGVPGAGGAAVPPVGGLGGVAGDSGVSLTPTFDQAAADRLNAANAAHGERKATFGVDPIKSALATTGFKGEFRMPDGQVPGKFFHAGPAGFEHVQAAVKASPDSLPVLQDYAAMSLKRAAMRDDGTIDPAKYERWAANHQDALRALPADTQARFSTAADAGQAVADASVARAQAIRNAQASAAADVAQAVAERKARMTSAERSLPGKIANLAEPEDIARTVGSVFGSKTAVQDMRALANAAKDNPDAQAGLRQAVADHILTNYVGNTEAAASGQAQIKADSFQTFMKRHGPTLQAAGFSPDEIGTMRLVAEDIQRAKRSENAVKLPGGSNTPQDAWALGKAAMGKSGGTLLTVLGAALGGAATHALGPAGMVAGETAGAGISALLQGFRSVGIQKVDDLVTRAMLDPELARALLAKVPDPTTDVGKAAVKVRARDVMRLLAGTSATQAAPPGQQEPPAAPASNALAR